MSIQLNSSRSRKATSFRIGRVRAYLRGRVWYLCYHEDGRRHQPRVGPERDVARQMAAEINAQLEVGAPSALWFQPVSFAELRQRWLDYHEHVLHSSVATVRRYRQAARHLLNFIRDVRPLRRVSDFRPCHAEEFARYLRSIGLSPSRIRRWARFPTGVSFPQSRRARGRPSMRAARSGSRALAIASRTSGDCSNGLAGHGGGADRDDSKRIWTYRCLYRAGRRYR
jgi:hypothetical protein